MPGAFAPLAAGPASALTYRVVPVADLFGPAARRLQEASDTDALLHALHDLLRARLPAEPDPRVEALDRRRRQDWTRFALDLGYYDHAHFLRDFRSLVGVSSAEYESQTLSSSAGIHR